MGQIFIKANLDNAGLLCKMKCYINNNEICKLKNNDTYFFEVEEERVEFYCKVTGYPKSDTFVIDFTEANNVVIEAIAGLWNPKVRIKYENNSSPDAIKQKTKQNFNVTRSVGDYLYIDETKKQWALTKGIINMKVNKVYNYTDIVAFELIEDGLSVTRGGLGAAIIGGAAFGSTGAIVGGLTGAKKTKHNCVKLQIKITLNDINNPVEYIDIISNETKKDSIVYKYAYKNAQEILSLFQLMYNEVNTNESVDDLKKYKELLDMNIITQEEFDAKKRKILDL